MKFQYFLYNVFFSANNHKHNLISNIKSNIHECNIFDENKISLEKTYPNCCLSSIDINLSYSKYLHLDENKEAYKRKIKFVFDFEDIDINDIYKLVLKRHSIIVEEINDARHILDLYLENMKKCHMIHDCYIAELKKIDLNFDIKENDVINL
jgi:hypothetical protein